MDKKFIAYLGGKEVRVLKGLKKNEDFFVEISTEYTKKTISVWKLSCPNSKHSNALFQEFFGVSFKDARNIHIEIKRKKKEKLRLVSVSSNKKTILMKYNQN